MHLCPQMAPSILNLSFETLVQIRVAASQTGPILDPCDQNHLVILRYKASLPPQKTGISGWAVCELRIIALRPPRCSRYHMTRKWYRISQIYSIISTTIQQLQWLHPQNKRKTRSACISQTEQWMAQVSRDSSEQHLTASSEYS